MAQELTAKQERFVAGIIEGKSQGQAYLDAGYKAGSMASASQLGMRLLKKVHIQEALNGYKAEIKEKAVLDAAGLLEELRPIITCATSDYIRMDEEGNMSLIREAINDPVKSRAIRQIRPTQYGVEIVFHDKLRAIEQYARMTGADQPQQDDRETVRVVYDDDIEELMEHG